MYKRDQNDFSSSSFSRVVCLVWSGSANTKTIILTPWPTRGAKQDPEYEGERTHTESEQSCQLECNGEGRSATIWPADTLLRQVQSDNVRAWEWVETETREGMEAISVSLRAFYVVLYVFQVVYIPERRCLCWERSSHHLQGCCVKIATFLLNRFMLLLLLLCENIAKCIATRQISWIATEPKRERQFGRAVPILSTYLATSRTEQWGKSERDTYWPGGINLLYHINIWHIKCHIDLPYEIQYNKIMSINCWCRAKHEGLAHTVLSTVLWTDGQQLLWIPCLGCGQMLVTSAESFVIYSDKYDF